MTMSRRRLLAGLVGAPFAATLVGCDDDDPPSTAVDGELLGPSHALGHRLRDGVALGDWDGAPEERVGVVVAGGGPAGVAAGWRLVRRGMDDLVVLDLEPEPGGTSRAGRSDVTRYPWGAHYVPVPMAHDRELIALLHEMGALEGTDGHGDPVGAEHLLVRQPESRVFYRGFWYPGLYPHAGATDDDRAQLERFRSILDGWVGARDGRGRRAFAIPTALGSDDPEVMALDRLSAAAWLDREGLTSSRLRWLVDYACRDDYGLTAEQTSAWAAVFYWAARTPRPGEDTMALLTWPEGNAALVDHMAAAIGDRLRPGHLVVDVEPVEGGARVRALRADGRPVTLIAERVVMATPRFIARRVVRPLHDRADEGFAYGAWLVANAHLSERPREDGYPACWDNVIHDSPGLGYVTATHQRGRDLGPTVLTYFLPMTDDDPRQGRRRLLDASFATCRDLVVGDLSRPHRDLPSCLTRLDVWRWGHAMIQPRVGFVSSRPRRRAALPVGAIHFAHSDLSGVALFEEAFAQGLRAADEVVAARRPPPGVVSVEGEEPAPT